MATLTIEVPDELGEALASCDFMAIDQVAAENLLREAIHSMSRTLEDLSKRLQGIYDSHGGGDELRTLASEIKGVDLAGRINRIADGLGAVA
jgi:hypothetical protein